MSQPDMKMPSVEWFSPSQLWRTAQKVNASTLVAEYADRRETQAGFAPIYDVHGKASYHDLSGKLDEQGKFSFDFVADTGDGWEATRAVAELMLRPTLKLENSDPDLPRPNLVLFGGDLVYPTASRTEYKRRLIEPFNDAAKEQKLPTPKVEDRVEPNSPRAFAIPGNHDWYDGLTGFWSLFCRSRLNQQSGYRSPGRWVGPFVAEQQRSYFALKLPYNWWVWGIDIALTEWVDQPQANYFKDLAEHPMKKGDKLIVCTAEPSWVHAHAKTDGEKHFQALGWMINQALDHEIDVRAVLTGDLHHYSRYEGELVHDEGELVHGRNPNDPNKRHPCTFFTAGGGGAFSSATHQLPGRIDIVGLESWSAKLQGGIRACTYPDRLDSWLYSLRFLNPFCFSWQNPSFFLATILVWALTGTALKGGHDLFFNLLAALPWIGLVGFAKLGAKRFLEEKDNWLQHWPWFTLGLAHAAVQLVVGYTVGACVWGQIQANFPAILWLEHGALGWARTFVFGVCGAFSTCFIMGIYLLICTNSCQKVHDNEAFSALRSTRWKNFLRIVLDANGEVNVHAIGLDNLDNLKGEPHLIETTPLCNPNPEPTPSLWKTARNRVCSWLCQTIY